MRTSRLAAALVALVLADLPAAAPECGAAGAMSSATGVAAAERRRDAAATYLGVVHAAQRRAHAEGGRYLQLHELPNLPAAPVGFVPRVVADQWSYAIALKDLFDACGFALFSDEHGVVYEAVPRLIQAVPPRPPGNAPDTGTVSGTLVPSTGTVDPFTGAAAPAILNTP